MKDFIISLSKRMFSAAAGAILSVVLLCSGAQAAYWTENNLTDFGDGYYVLNRTTATPDNRVALNQVLDWYDTAWLNRRPLYIDNTASGEDLVQYQLSFTFNTKAEIDGGKMNEDMSDIRFADSDGQTMLPYYIASDSGTATQFVVKVSSIPTASTKTIFIYYNNLSTHTSFSSQKRVYDLFEDWESGAIDTSLWENLSTLPFTIVTSSAQNGSYSAQSGLIGNDQVSDISVTLNLEMAAMVTYYAAASSEPNYDKLTFYLDDLDTGEISASSVSGEQPWLRRVYQIPAGTHKLIWRFRRDSVGDGGLNRAWLDTIVVNKWVSVIPDVTEGTTEGYSGIHTLGLYQSSVLDTGAEQAEVQYTSWTALTTGGSVSIQMRSSDSLFVKNDVSPSWSLSLTNGAKPLTIPKGRYIQYRGTLSGSGTTTPYLVEISIEYTSPPTAPSGFTGTVLSSSSIRWDWTDNASGALQEDGYRLYSSTGGVITNLPADTEQYTEYNLQPNTKYCRWAGVYNANGTNLSNSATTYTKAHEPCNNSEVFGMDTESNAYYYTPILTGTEVFTSTFTFTSDKSTTTIEYYRVAFTTDTEHVFTADDASWIPLTSTVTHPYSGDTIVKKPEIFEHALFNATSWYFHARTYNYENAPSGITRLGPYNFQGCPAAITDITAKPATDVQGSIVLTWTAPSADGSRVANLTGGKYIIKGRSSFVILNEAQFNGAEMSITLSTSAIAGQPQSHTITGLIPGAVWGFAIKSVDSENNYSALSYNVNASTDTRTAVSSIAKIVFKTDPKTTYVGKETSDITIETQDAFDNPMKVTEETVINLDSTSGTRSFGQGGTWGLTSVAIPAGQTQATFQYRDTTDASPTITVAENPSQGWTDGTQVQTITPAKAVRYMIDHAGSGNIGADQTIYIRANDGYNVLNTSEDYLGDIVVTGTIAGITITPSTHTFTAANAGLASFIIANKGDNATAGPIIYSAQESITQDYRDVQNSMLVGNGGIVRSRDDSARWFTQKYSSGTENGLFGLSSPDGTSIWAAGTQGNVLRSTDSGDSWRRINTGLTADKTLYSVYFVTVSTGWAVGDTGKIVKSTDTGITWTEQVSGVATRLKSVFFVNLSTGWAVGDTGTLLKTMDSGNTWQDIGLGAANLNRVYFFDYDTGFITGDGGLIYKTVDAGENWTVKTVPAEATANLHAIDFFSASLGYAAGASRTVLKTTNGGESWALAVATATTPDFYGLSFVGSNSDKITAVGTGAKILQTTDSGATWNETVLSGVSTPFTWNGLIVSSITVQATRFVQGRLNNGLKVAIRTFASGTSSVNQIRVKRSGTAADSDVTSVVIYRDANGNQFYDSADTKLGESAFSSGRAAIDVSRTFSTTTDYLFIMPNMAVTSEGLGKTMSLSLEFSPDTDRFLSVSGGVQMARNNLPFTSSELEIVPSSCTLNLGVGNLSPVEVKQGQRTVMISSFTMITDRGETPWRQLIVTRSGINNADSDIESVNLYRSLSPSFADASLIATGVFGASAQGLAHISVSPEQYITASATNYYFLAADISPSAVFYTDNSDARFWLSYGLTTSYFLLDGEGANGIKADGASFTSNQIRIKQAADTLVVSPIATLDFDIDQSKVAPCLPMRLYVTETGARVDITKIHIIQSGTASDSDIDSVRLYKDSNGNGLLDPATDALLGSGTLVSKETDIILDVPEIITSTLSNYATYFIAAAVSKRASVDNTIRLNINTSGITLAGSDNVSSANFPLNSAVATITNYRDVVNVTFTSLAPRDARVDETGIAVAKMKLWAYCGAVFTKATLEYTGTGSVANVKAVKIYADTDSDESFSTAADTLIGNGTFAGDGKSEITFSVPPAVYDSSYTVFVVYDLESTGTPQRTAGVGVSDSSLIFPGESGAYAFGYYQSNTMNLLSKETPSVPQLTMSIGWPSGKRIDGETVYFSNKAAELQFSWQADALNGIARARYAVASFGVVTTTDTPDLVSWATTEDADTLVQDLNLKHNTLYYLWVKAVSTDGFERVTSVPLKVDLTAPAAPSKPGDTSPKSKSPSDLAASKAPVSSYWVAWDSVEDPESGVLYYELQERTDTSPVWHSISTTTNAEYRVVKDTATDGGKFFYYRVRAMNYAGTLGEFSDSSLAAYLSLPADFIKDLASYPNPFDSRRRSATITFILNQAAEITFRIYDLFGGLVKEWKITGAAGENTSLWDGCDDGGQKVAAGMYILHSEIKGSEKTEKKRYKIGVIH